MPEELRLTLLGLPHVTLGGAPVTGFVSGKAQALLYYLAITRRSHSRQSLAALFWGEMPDTNARANLRVSLCNLRQLFPDHLSAGRDTLGFNCAAPYWLDVEVFQSALQQANASLGEPVAAAVGEALALYRGECLEGFNVDDAPDFEAWALLQREQLRHVALQALHALTIHYTEQGAYKLGIEYAMRLLALDPWREEAHRQLMLLLALDRQRSAALAQYETCRRILATELGIEPLEETTNLYERIRAGRLNQPAAQSREILPLQFVGRGDEHAWLVRQWKAAQNGTRIMALIDGETGIGKTRLAEEMLHHARSQDAIVLQARCYEFRNGVPYQPIADLLQEAGALALVSPRTQPESWLDELARLLPGIDGHMSSAPAAGDETARRRLFEATARLVRAASDTAWAQGRWLIIFLDDLHWCDSATMDLLRYLIYHLHGQHVWFLGTYRPEDLAADHSLRTLRHTLGREDRVAMLHLEPFQSAAVLQLARVLIGAPDHHIRQLAAFLDRQSGRNPFILSQLIQEFAARGILRPIGDRWEIVGKWAGDPAPGEEGRLEVPFCVREMILERVERLEPAAQRLLQLAAVAMPRLDAELLDMLAEDLHTAGNSLASCLESRLLVCLQPDSYDFALDIIRQVIYSSILPSLRQQLQYNLARAYERLARARQKLRRSTYRRHVLVANNG